MNKVPINQKEQQNIQDFTSLADHAYRNPFDREAVTAFFRAYEQLESHDQISQVKYLQLKYRHQNRSDQWLTLKILGELFLNEGKNFPAYISLVESLRLNPNQSDVIQLALSLKDKVKPKIPEKLSEDTITVSVIMPTFNRGQEIRKSIESVLNQNFIDFELIIINDGGSGLIEEIINLYQNPKIKYFRLKSNKGLAAALNEGILRARGKYIAYLDDDDIYYSEHLETLVKALEASPHRLVYAKTQKVIGTVKEGEFKLTRLDRILGQPFNKDVLLKKTFVTTCSVMLEKSIFKEVGLFREDLKMSLDWELWLRCALNIDFKHVNRVLAEYRWKEDNSTRKNAVQAAFFGKVMPKFYGYYQGQVAFVKHYLQINNPNKAKEYYREICNQFSKTPKALEVIDELIPLSFCFKDKMFLKKLYREYFRLDAGRYLRELLSRKSWLMFSTILLALPDRVLKSIGKRLKRLLDK